MTRLPITNILSSLINLKELELDCSWNCLENLYLPFLQNLKAKTIPGEKLASLIEIQVVILTKLVLNSVYRK
jgi:hypothetical protein